MTTRKREQVWPLNLCPVSAQNAEAGGVATMKPDARTVETSMSRLRSDDSVTTSKLTWSRDAIESGL